MRTVSNTGTGSRRIEERLARLAHAGATTLGALAGRRAQIELSAVGVRTGGELLARVAQPLILIRHRLTGDHGEIGYLLGRREAVTLACLSRPGVTDEEIVRRRLAAVPDPREIEEVRDVAWLLAESSDRALRAMTNGRVGVGFEELTPLSAATVERALPAQREHAVMRMRLLLDGVPPTDIAMLVEPRAHDLLDADEPELHIRENRASAAPSAGGTVRTGLHAFLTDEDAVETTRRCGAKLGLEFVRHPAQTAPNPSVLRDGVVLLDVPLDAEHRFDWCRRLKQGRPDLHVVLLVHQPTRSRVLKGFEARADLVIAWPTDAIDLAVRLRRLPGRKR